MQLKLAEKTLNYPMLRLISENDVWEMGLYPVIYGVRVSCNRIGSGTYLKGGYCCGRSPLLVMEVCLAIALILSTFDESAEEWKVDLVLPQWNLRPINRDDGLANLRRVVRRFSHVKIPPIQEHEKFLDELEAIANNLEFCRQNALNYIWDKNAQ